MNKTQQNILRAFAGESQARNKYATFAKMARKEGYEWIARIFDATAENEKIHAEELFELIKEPLKTDGGLEIAPFSNKTVENLKAAAIGEKYEWSTMYPDFEKIAKEEGETAAENLFSKLKSVEADHEERYIIIARKMDENTLYNSETEMEWRCVNCGYTHFGNKPPITCPLCKKPYTWYEPMGIVK